MGYSVFLPHVQLEQKWVMSPPLIAVNRQPDGLQELSRSSYQTSSSYRLYIYYHHVDCVVRISIFTATLYAGIHLMLITVGRGQWDVYTSRVPPCLSKSFTQPSPWQLLGPYGASFFHSGGQCYL